MGVLQKERPTRGGGRVRKGSAEGRAPRPAPRTRVSAAVRGGEQQKRGSLCARHCGNLHTHGASPDVRDREREFVSLVPFHSHF